jgi:hypothetical protein
MPPKHTYLPVVDWLLIHQSSLMYLSVTRIGHNCEYRPFIEESLFLMRHMWKTLNPLIIKVTPKYYNTIISTGTRERFFLTIYFSQPNVFHIIEYPNPESEVLHKGNPNII